MGKTISEFLVEHAKKQPVSFHMPGHKGSRIYRENGYGEILDNLMDMDVTEIPGADNLYQPEEIIRETMNRYKTIYNSRETYLLVNGSSSGLIAAIMTCVPKGGKLLMARNCHKSIYNGAYMQDAACAYMYPEIADGITGAITPEEVSKALVANPDADAVILPSPNYYGILSDIKTIADIVHDAGKVLIVDQAHGAHLALFDKYLKTDRSAEKGGADIIINSTHKTLASFTQSAIANINSDRISMQLFESKLQLVESTSPSYILMTSMDVNADLINKKGGELIKGWQENLEYFYREAEKIPGLVVYRWNNLDESKINIDMSLLGLNGHQLEEALMEKGIFIELTTGNILMCMTGIGNRRYDFDRLLEALRELSAERCGNMKNAKCAGDADDTASGEQGEPLPIVFTKPKQREIPEHTVSVRLAEAAGCICASQITPYPPGVPLLCPGEVIEKETAEYIQSLVNKGEKVIGVDKGHILVGK